MSDDQVYLYALEVEGYVADCDLSEPTGRGVVTFTKDIDAAKGFDSAMDALMFWRRQHMLQPIREDGQPNRPLTAFTVELRRRVE